MEALRPPLVNPKLKRVMGTEAEPVFELAPGVAQVFDHVCLSDEAYLQQTSNGGNFFFKKSPWFLARRDGASRTRQGRCRGAPAHPDLYCSGVSYISTDTSVFSFTFSK